MHVAEGLVERRHRDHVGGGVQALDIPSGAHPDHSRAELEPPGQLLIRARIALACHDEAAALVGELGEGPEQRGQPLALEAGAHE